MLSEEWDKKKDMDMERKLKKNVVVTGDEIHPGAMGISETC